MSLAQRAVLALSLRDLMITELHVGDCIGADAEATRIAHVVGIATVCHPPENPARRAFTTGHIKVMPELPYLVRDRAIVDDTQLLIAAPFTAAEQRRSGTWYTIRYCRGRGKQVLLIPRGVQLPFEWEGR
jgi:hypothetical protein